MSDHGGEGPSGDPIPETAITDRDKAEFMAYESKPYQEMAIQARASGMAEADIQNVLHLGEKREIEKARAFEKWEGALAESLAKVSEEMGPDSSESPRAVIEFDKNHLPEEMRDLDAYRSARDKLYQFLGVIDQRPPEDEFLKLETKPGKIEGMSVAVYPVMESPLGLHVCEFHYGSQFTRAGDEHWTNYQGVLIQKT